MSRSAAIWGEKKIMDWEREGNFTIIFGGLVDIFWFIAEKPQGILTNTFKLELVLLLDQ